MAKTLDNLRDYTRMFLDEAVATDWSDEQVDFAINNGYHQVVTAVMETYEDFYLTSTTINTVANQQEYGSADSMPTNIMKIRRLEINYDTSASSSYNRAAYVRLDEIARDIANTNGVSPFSRPSYYVYGQNSSFKIGFIPIPNNSDTNAIKIFYIPYVADLSSASDSVNIPYPDRYWESIAWYAAGSLMSKGQQEEISGNKYLQKFDIDMQKMRQQLEDRAADGVKHIIDTELLDVDFSSYGLL